MLAIFRAQKDSGDLGKNISALLVPGWDPKNTTVPVTSPWGKKDESGRDTVIHGPEVCWNSDGNVVPLSLKDMTVEEKEVFSRTLLTFGEWLTKTKTAIHNFRQLATKATTIRKQGSSSK